MGRITPSSKGGSGSMRRSPLIEPYLPGYWVGAYGSVPQGMSTYNAGFTSASTLVQNHQLAIDCTDLRVVLPYGWFLNSGGAGGDTAQGTHPTKVALQLGTTIIPVTFDGKRAATIDAGGLLISDPLSGIWAKDSQLKVRVLHGGISGQVYPNLLPAMGPGINPAFANHGFTTNVDNVDSTTNPTIANANDDLWGVNLLGRPLVDKPFVLGIVGDSITVGTGDTGIGFSWVTRATNAQVPVFRTSRGGMNAQQYAANSHYSLRMFSGCTHVIQALGVNDLGRTVAQIKADLTKIYRGIKAQGAVAIGATITPWTNSTDGWTTVGGQTINGGGAGSTRAQINAWIRSGADGLLGGYVETADAVETARDSGLWKANFTADGIHPNAAAHAAMAAAVNLTAIAAL